MYNKGLFHDWVPKPVMLLLLIVFLFPILFVSGIYASNSSQMISDLGILPEHISMARYAMYIGMGVILPLMGRIKTYLRSKEMMITCLSMLALLSIVCATTSSPYVLIFSSFFIGIFKLLALLDVVMIVMVIISPSGERGMFYSIFYPLSISSGQISTFITAKIAYNLQWQSVYIIMAIILLVLVLLAVIFMHNLRFSKKVPLYYFDWFSMLLYVVSLMFLNYIFSFSKQQDWFHSFNIKISLIAFFFFIIWFFYRQSKLKRPYISLGIFTKKSYLQGFSLLMFLGLFLSSGTIQSTYTSGVLGYDSVTNSLLNVAMVIGVVMAGFISFYGFKRNLSMKYFIMFGFASFTLYAIYMYFVVTTVIDFEYLIIPMILKGLGMTVLYIGIWYYSYKDLGMSDFLPGATFLIVIRSFLGVGFFSAIVAWLYYKLQLVSLSDLSVGMDTVNLAPQGGGMAVYKRVKIQSIIAATKIMYGYYIIGGIVVLTYLTILRFNALHYRRLILIKKIINRESIKGYRFRKVKTKKEEIITDSVGAAM